MPFRVETTFTGLRGAPGYNRLHFDTSLDQDQISAQSAANAVVAFWTGLAGVMSELVSWRVQPEVSLVSDTGDTTIATFFVDGGSGTGAQSADPIPWASQGLLRLRTGVYVGGRETRGRVFLPGATEDFNVQGQTSSGYRDLVQTAAVNLTENDPSLVVVGKNGPAVVESAQVWPEWAMLTSRRD